MSRIGLEGESVGRGPLILGDVRLGLELAELRLIVQVDELAVRQSDVDVVS